MLKEDLGAEQDEENAAAKLGRKAIACAEEVADLDTQGGERRGDDTDQKNGNEKIDVQNAEGDPDSQRVDAGGKRHGKHDHHTK